MNKFNFELLMRRRIAQGLTFRALSELTKQVDPHGKGVSPMTCQRLETGLRPSIDSLLLVSDALGISARSTFSR